MDTSTDQKSWEMDTVISHSDEVKVKRLLKRRSCTSLLQSGISSKAEADCEKNMKVYIYIYCLLFAFCFLIVYSPYYPL